MGFEGWRIERRLKSLGHYAVGMDAVQSALHLPRNT